MTATSSRPKLAAAPVESAVTGEELLDYFRRMLLLRRFEEKAGQMYGMGLIGGFCHLYIGQEAVAVGIEQAIGREDPVVTSYRCHGHAVARGVPPRLVFSELMGRRTGISKGKGGSMHMFSLEKDFYGGHGIVGAHVPIGTGLAFAHAYRGSSGVCLTYFGDGAANQGQVYEAFNMAALWTLPVVYIIENNRYAMGTSVERSAAQSDFFRRGTHFGVPGKQVDGMDVLAVREAGAEAVAACRAGGGPVLLEVLTYRYRGHSMSDPATYRSRDEVSRVREERDPIDRVRGWLLDGELAREDEIKAIGLEIREIVDDAARHAQASPEPEPSELYADVYADA